MLSRDLGKKEFDDEVDYPVGQSVIDRFEKFVGLKNFKTTEWTKMVIHTLNL